MTEGSAPPSVSPEPQQLKLEKATVDWRSTQTQMVAGLIGIIVVSFTVYWPAIGFPFQGSDLQSLTDTLKVFSGDNQSYLADLSGKTDTGAFGFRPMFYLAVLFESIFFRSESAGYHIIAILLLCATAALLSLVVLEITGKFGNRLGACPAVWAGLLFAVYPWNSTMIVTLNGLEPLLGSFFSLLALFTFLRYRLIQETGYLYVSIVASALSALSWDSGVLFPVVLTLSLILPDATNQPARSRIDMLAPYWTLALLYVIARPDWVHHMSELAAHSRFNDLSGIGMNIWQMIIYAPEEPIAFPGFIALIAVLAVMGARLVIAQESYRAALFVFLWAFVYLFQPSGAWSAAFIPPLCAMMVIIVLPAIDRLGKGFSTLYATAGSQFLICLFCYWAYRMLTP
jgi:hypothetical protein